MGDSASDTLRDVLVSAWAPANTRIPKTTSAGIEHIVHFLAHPQIDGAHEWPIAVEISKIMDPPNNENQVIHPRFTEVHHKYTITCRYRVRNINETLFDQSFEDIEDMCVEVVRILQTQYDPQSDTGAFFQCRYNWANQDNLKGEKPELKRVLSFDLVHIQSRSSTTFQGYGGVLAFDTSATTADSKPGADYEYTEAFNVEISEGTETIEALGKDTANGFRVPKLGSGAFRGRFRAQIYLKSGDIGSTADKLNKIYILQANGEHAEVVFLHDTGNTASSTLTQTSYVKITNITKTTTDEELVKMTIEGRLTKPSVFAVA